MLGGSIGASVLSGSLWCIYFKTNDEDDFWPAYTPPDGVIWHFIYFVIFTMILSFCSSVYSLISLDRGWLLFGIIMQLAMAGGCFVQWESSAQNVFSALVMVSCGFAVVSSWRLCEAIEDSHWDDTAKTYRDSIRFKQMPLGLDLPDMDLTHYRIGTGVSSFVMLFFAAWFLYFGIEQPGEAENEYMMRWQNYILFGVCLAAAITGAAAAAKVSRVIMLLSMAIVMSGIMVSSVFVGWRAMGYELTIDVCDLMQNNDVAGLMNLFGGGVPTGSFGGSEGTAVTVLESDCGSGQFTNAPIWCADLEYCLSAQTPCVAGQPEPVGGCQAGLSYCARYGTCMPSFLSAQCPAGTYPGGSSRRELQSDGGMDCSYAGLWKRYCEDDDQCDWEEEFYLQGLVINYLFVFFGGVHAWFCWRYEEKLQSDSTSNNIRYFDFFQWKDIKTTVFTELLIHYGTIIYFTCMWVFSCFHLFFDLSDANLSSDYEKTKLLYSVFILVVIVVAGQVLWCIEIVFRVVFSFTRRFGQFHIFFMQQPVVNQDGLQKSW
eukprot:UN34806